MKKFYTTLLTVISLFSYLFSGAQTVSGSLTATDPVFNRPNEGAPPTSISTQGTNVYYDVIPITISIPGLVTFACIGSANFDTFGLLYGTAGFDPLNPLTNVLIGDDDSGPGVNFGITYNFTSTGTYYLVVTTFKPGNTGTYTITSTQGGALPVRLLSFTAEKTNAGKNLLKWTSAGEINISKYEVQHSNDGLGFKSIVGSTIVARNVSINSYYNFADDKPFEKLNFYRLKITDKDGKVSFSTVAVISNNKSVSSASITVFPNPAVNFLNIQTKAGQKGKASVSIISNAGQIVYKSDYTLSDESIVYLDVKKLAAGNYNVRIKTADGKTTNIAFIKY